MDVKFTPNMFIEVNELNRLKKSLKDDGYKKIIQYLSQSFGIAKNSNNTFFKASQKDLNNNTVIINAGIAIDSAVNIISLTDNAEVVVNNTGIKHWITISHAVSNNEEGTVSVSLVGELNGLNTKFTDVLRGQPDYPTKVKLTSTQNTSEYEVIDITSDTVATLSGLFVAESNLKYQVVGTFTPGFQVADDDKLIYEYDSCNINVIESEEAPVLAADEYLICSVSYNATSGAMEIVDERILNMFNNPYKSTNNSDDVNECASLLNSKVIGINNSGITLELILQNGYEVSKCEFVTTASSNIINIISGSNNFLGSGDIQNGFFAGWLLINRSNMKFATILTNVNHSLYLTNFDPTIINDNTADFIIVPNFKEIEFEVTASNNVVVPSAPYYYRKSLFNITSRLQLNLFFKDMGVGYDDSVILKIRYRMNNYEDKEYPFHDLAIAQFNNVVNQSETLADSSFAVNVTSFEPSQRNYS